MRRPNELLLAMGALALVALAFALVGGGCGDDDAITDASVRDGGAADGGSTDGAHLDDAGASDSGIVISDRTYWVATDGDDANDGSEATPYRSFPHAIAGLLPGDTLIVKDGDYGTLSYDCSNNACEGEPCPSGAPGGPITVRAENERRVTLFNTSTAPLQVRGCSHVVLDGFVAHQADDSTATGSSQLALVVEADHVVVRRGVFHSPNRYFNTHGLYVVASDHVLFEENEVYDFHRGAITVAASTFVTMRRNYVNSRDTPNLTDGYSCCCLDRGDYGILMGQSYRTTVENNIVEKTCEGFYAYGVSYSSRDLGPISGKATRLIGNIALNDNTGFRAGSSCGSVDVCIDDDRISDIEAVDCVSVGASTAFNFDGVDNAVLRNVTSIDASSSDFRFIVGSDNAALAGAGASFIALNALDTGTTGSGYRFGDQREGLVAHGNSFGNTDDFPDGVDFVEGTHGTTDPALGACTVYVPASSPMKNAGLDGDIGANIVSRTIDGRLTTEPLWDRATGAFPCGAVIPGGVNDDAIHPGATCTSVHERLEVGTAACPLP